MKELIKITEQNGNKAVFARDLHLFLEVKTDFKNWIVRRTEEYGFIENQDFEVLVKNDRNSNGGRPLKEYVISLDMAKELSMVEKTEKGRQARRYFIEMEKIAREPVKHLFLANNSREERIASRAALLEMIKQNLFRGDIKQISEETGLTYKMLRCVLCGTHQSNRYLEALYNKALENRKAGNRDYTQMILQLK
ncbi:TPA: toxin-antitoxin system, toxin component, Bro domain protein [Elizabethkingia anophelis]|nr:toxin-antitoxin system, toxin component, Bro domain protein [Elizabethkingia anophelis]HAT4009597.1 toxin-antitoxin system, toxin component, Bro domain protein [Elizabethkingia anophelis]